MPGETLSGALAREHREIDAGIEAFAASPEQAVTGPLSRALEALRRHIYLEEQFLFPPLREAGLMAPVFVMLREHGQMWQQMDAVQAALSDESESAAALARCRELMAQLAAHNSKEEQILYPEADRTLTATAGAELSAFLDAGELPADWVPPIVLRQRA